MAQLVKCPTSAQAMISGLWVQAGIRLCALDSVSPSLSAPAPLMALSVSLSKQIFKKKFSSASPFTYSSNRYRMPTTCRELN